MRRSAWLAALLAGWATATSAASCEMDPADQAWLERALDNWARVEREYLLLEPQPLPTVIAIDGACTYRLPAGHLGSSGSAAHDGTVSLPDGNTAPLGPISFASGEGDSAYFAISLPSVCARRG